MFAAHIAAAAPEIKAAAEIMYSPCLGCDIAHPGLEHEGVLRSEVLIESKTPAQFLTEELKILAQQFLQQIFINSGGARYLPRISAETALVEDFAETEAADAPSKLLDALRLSRRRGLARSGLNIASFASPTTCTCGWVATEIGGNGITGPTLTVIRCCGTTD
jgi:hypothetical protein